MSSDTPGADVPSRTPVIDVRGLRKVFRLPGEAREITLAEQLLRRVRHPLVAPRQVSLVALDGLDLTIDAGEAVGLIGRNGAGKSTLLKVLSRITAPTSGTIRLRGRVGSLLEVGTGFHPELTGRENIYLSGSILGMRRSEIVRHFDSIVDFAGVAKFLDLPVKRYSSGMYVRLAFAVAAHMDTEILLVDEVLAVGDADFQALSSAKMREIVMDGRTVVLVSHQMRTISDICGRAVVLDKGAVTFDGDVTEGVSHYVSSAKAYATTERDPQTVGSPVVVSRVSAEKALFRPDEPKKFRVEVAYDGSVPVDRFFVSVNVKNADGSSLANCDSHNVGHWYSPSVGRQTLEFSLEHPWLQPGEYWLDLTLCNAGVLDVAQQVCWFSVDTELPYAFPPELHIARRDVFLPSYTFSPIDAPA